MNKNEDVIMMVYLKEKEISTITVNVYSEQEVSTLTELKILAFDIHQHIVGNGNNINRITTHAFEIRCNPKDSSLLITLLLR